jgi:Zn finger protein HypA/HybF involved in hydrogenase expression
MQELTMDLQHVAHCGHCGASYFEDDGINRISIEKVEKLSRDITEDVTDEPAVKLCPYDNAALAPIHNPDAIPSHVTLYACPTCHSILATIQNLIDFKQAQDAKINYIKVWRMPLGSLKNVFAIFVLAALSVGIYYTYQGTQQTSMMRTEAAQSINNVTVVRSARFGILSFTTSQPYRSSVILINKTTGTSTTVAASDVESTTHTATFSLPNETDVVYYTIELTSGGRSVNSPEAPLEISTNPN